MFPTQADSGTGALDRIMSHDVRSERRLTGGEFRQRNYSFWPISVLMPNVAVRSVAASRAVESGHCGLCRTDRYRTCVELRISLLIPVLADCSDEDASNRNPRRSRYSFFREPRHTQARIVGLIRDTKVIGI